MASKGGPGGPRRPGGAGGSISFLPACSESGAVSTRQLGSAWVRRSLSRLHHRASDDRQTRDKNASVEVSCERSNVVTTRQCPIQMLSTDGKCPHMPMLCTRRHSLWSLQKIHYTCTVSSTSHTGTATMLWSEAIAMVSGGTGVTSRLSEVFCVSVILEDPDLVVAVQEAERLGGTYTHWSTAQQKLYAQLVAPLIMRTGS